mmetsp:Transcript_26485/g.30782  ORF Transcript_26485/g.30782 Transcript_26485/m.30782 type:complete len:742 (-) Transcript_26485:113-2338(-)
MTPPSLPSSSVPPSSAKLVMPPQQSIILKNHDETNNSEDQDLVYIMEDIETSTGTATTIITNTTRTTATESFKNRMIDSTFGAFGSSEDDRQKKTTQSSNSNNNNDEDYFNFFLGDRELVNVDAAQKKSILNIPSSSSISIARDYGYKYDFTEDDDDEEGCDEEDNDEENHNQKPNEKEPSTSLFTKLTASYTGTATTQNSASSSSNQNETNKQNQNDPNYVPYNIHLLGKTYHPILDYTQRRDYESNLLWLTYRCDFVEIKPYNITSDAGWGCMLRSAQMLLCQALRVHYCGRKYILPRSTVQRRANKFIQDVSMWFADYPSVDTGSFYSLHNMVAAGCTKYDVLPGEWFGPGTACHVLRDLVQLHARAWGAKYNKKAGTLSGTEDRTFSSSVVSDDDDDATIETRKDENDDETNTNASMKNNNNNTSKSSTTDHHNPSYQRDEQAVMKVYVAPEGSIYRHDVEELMTNNDNDKNILSTSTVNKKKKKSVKQVDHNDDDNVDTTYDKIDFETLLEDPNFHPLSDISQKKTSRMTMKEWDTSLLILVPLRLGLKQFNAASYKIPLSHVLSLSQSVGFIGGSPRHALWFYGANSDGSKVYGLDPHTVQRAPRRRKLRPDEILKTGNTKKHQVQLSDEYLRSFSCPNISTMNMSRIDPSLALGFYCRDREDFENFCSAVETMKTDDVTKDFPGLFSVADAKPDYNADVSSAMMDMMMGSSSSQIMDGDGDEETNNDDDDFVML